MTCLWITMSEKLEMHQMHHMILIYSYHSGHPPTLPTSLKAQNDWEDSQDEMSFYFNTVFLDVILSTKVMVEKSNLYA